MFIMFESMADVIANLILWQMFKPLLFMSDGIDMRTDAMALVVFVTDVIVTYVLIWWLMLLSLDVEFCLADVIANVGNHFKLLQGHLPMADVIAIVTC